MSPRHVTGATAVAGALLEARDERAYHVSRQTVLKGKDRGKKTAARQYCWCSYCAGPRLARGARRARNIRLDDEVMVDHPALDCGCPEAGEQPVRGPIQLDFGELLATAKPMKRARRVHSASVPQVSDENCLTDDEDWKSEVLSLGAASDEEWDMMEDGW